MPQKRNAGRSGYYIIKIIPCLPRNGDSCKKKKCPFRHTSVQKEIKPVEKIAVKEKVAAPVAPKAAEALVEPFQQPLQLQQLQQLPPFTFFNKAMFPLELLKRFEKKTNSDRELTIRWTKAWLKQRGDRKGYPYDPAEPEKFISIDYAFNKLSNEQLDAWMMGHILQ